MRIINFRNEQWFEIFAAISLVVLVLGICIPIYQDYTKQSYVSKMVNIANVAKAAVTDCYTSTQKYPDSNRANEITAALKSTDVSSINIANNGIVTVESNSKRLGTQLSMTLTPKETSEGIKWSCKATGQDLRMAPASCR